VIPLLPGSSLNLSSALFEKAQLLAGLGSPLCAFSKQPQFKSPIQLLAKRQWNFLRRETATQPGLDNRRGAFPGTKKVTGQMHL
jgi:hypothetical protein